MNESKICRKCRCDLTDDNWNPSHRITHIPVCKECYNKYVREYTRKNRYKKPSMVDNPKCPTYLGCYVAERVLANVFKNVKVMPINNPGFDFICNRNYKVDVKSACLSVMERQTNMWVFHIKRNIIADQFLLLAFNNREKLNPEYIWLIPGIDVNTKSSISISEARIHKWDDYKLDKLDDIIECCNSLKT